MVIRLYFDYDKIYTSEEDHKKAESISMVRDLLTTYPTPFDSFPTQTSEKILLAYHLPFSGLSILLQLKPSHYISWTCEAIVSPAMNELIIKRIIDNSTNAEKINAEIEKIIENIKTQVNHSTIEVNKYNESLTVETQKILNFRKNEILQLLGTLKKLNVPIRKSNESLAIVPIHKKNLFIKKPSAADQPYNPGWSLEEKIYKEILEIIHKTGISMEQHPSIYKNKHEEDLRDLFLMVLTLNFENATGETFNSSGKTDILIRYEGKNIFIAECKFWHGKENHNQTINQILSYLTWRDSKAAIIYFVKGKDINVVLSAIEQETPNHSRFKKFNGKENDSYFNYYILLQEDDTRGVNLAILVFHFIK